MASIVADIQARLTREVDSLVEDVVELMHDTGDVVKEIEQSVHANICDVVADTVDGMHGCATDKLRALLYPDAVDEDPIAEIRIPHPIGGEMVSIGCKLKVCKTGHVIQGIQSKSIAHKLNLRENDVVLQIDKQHVSYWTLQMVIQYLAEMKSTFTLVIKRKKPNSDDFVFIAIQIKISLEDGKIDVQVTGRYFIKPSPTHGPDVELRITGHSFDAYVYQDDTYTHYLNIQNNEPRVTPLNASNDDSYKFRVYQLQGWERTAFILSNDALQKTIQAPIAADSNQQSDAVLTDDRNEDIEMSPGDDVIADARMFYVTSSSVARGYYQYESVTYRGMFLSADNNGRLVLVNNPGDDRKALFNAIRTDQINQPPLPPPPPTNPPPDNKYGKPSIIHK